MDQRPAQVRGQRLEGGSISTPAMTFLATNGPPYYSMVEREPGKLEPRGVWSRYVERVGHQVSRIS